MGILASSLGTGEIILLLAFIAPFLLTLYCVIDILRSGFKNEQTKLLFLILVVLAPFLGSIIYLFLKRSYVKPPAF